MKPCPTCGKQPTVTANAPWRFGFVGSCHIDCCDHHACGDGLADAMKAWNEQPRLINVGLTEITSL